MQFPSQMDFRISRHSFKELHYRLDFQEPRLRFLRTELRQGTAIVWAIDTSQYGSPGPGPGPAVLYAFDATNIRIDVVEQYAGANNRDRAGNAVKFATPTISNGKVYVGTSTEVDVYGLIGANLPPNISSITPSSATVGGPGLPVDYQRNRICHRCDTEFRI